MFHWKTATDEERVELVKYINRLAQQELDGLEERAIEALINADIPIGMMPKFVLRTVDPEKARRRTRARQT